MWFYNSFSIYKMRFLLVINHLLCCSVNGSGYKCKDIKCCIQYWFGNRYSLRNYYSYQDKWTSPPLNYGWHRPQVSQGTWFFKEHFGIDSITIYPIKSRILLRKWTFFYALCRDIWWPVFWPKHQIWRSTHKKSRTIVKRS